MSKIAILIPHSYPVFNKQFVFSLLGVVSGFFQWNAREGNKHSLNIIVENGGWIDTMRENLAKKFLDTDYEYALWLDTDMLFPSNIIERMFNQINGTPIEAITGLYTWKSPPFIPHVYCRYNTDTGKFAIGGAFPLKESFKVEGAGFGCLMMKRSLLERVGLPRFKMELDGDDISVGEDLFFFKKAQPIEMLCDPTISCPHLAENSIDFSSHLMYNDIKVEDGEMIVSDEKLVQISEEHIKRIKRLQ